MKDYVLRIYRRERNDPKSLVGLVEEVEIKEKKAFNTYDELWEILNARKKDPRRVRAKCDG